MPLRGNELETDYSQTYKDEAFYLWYKNSRMSLNELIKILPLDERGKLPHMQSVFRWKQEASWDQWADGLDAKVSEQLDMAVITERVQMYKKHAEMGEKLSAQGMKYLEKEDGGIQSDAAAIRAVVEGIEIEGKNRGLADALSRVFAMDEKELDTELRKMLTNKSGEVDDEIDLGGKDIVDAEIKQEEDIE
jgi:hypothetical protein